jgi:mannose-binding lectin 2
VLIKKLEKKMKILIFFTFCLSAYCKLLENHSFSPPFEEVDSLGFRVPSFNWRAGGTTVVNSNFIRLTPDRQSKIGSLWSKKPTSVPSISAILKFRISGQGKNFFGDGLAMWIVQQGYYSKGIVHGFDEKFVGIGIIFDTFKNTENSAAHRDVTVLVNDGLKTYELMTENVKGCNLNVRYHADRADFSVLNASKAKLVLNEKA